MNIFIYPTISTWITTEKKFLAICTECRDPYLYEYSATGINTFLKEEGIDKKKVKWYVQLDPDDIDYAAPTAKTASELFKFIKDNVKNFDRR